MYQNDNKNINIQKYGCYLLSLFKVANLETGANFVVEDVEKKYRYYIDKGYMTETCYIISPAMILKDLTGKKWNVIYSREIMDNNYLIAKVFTKYQTYHFVLIDNEKTILYDSDKLLHNIQDSYKFIDYRLIKKA